jgi:hypothetical protein
MTSEYLKLLAANGEFVPRPFTTVVWTSKDDEELLSRVLLQARNP